MLFKWGNENLPVSSLKYGLVADSLAQTVGLKDGDLITKVNGKDLVYIDNLPKELLLNEKNSLTVRRNQGDTTINFPPGFLKLLTKNQLKNFVSVRYPIVVDSVLASATFTGPEKLMKGDSIIGIVYFNELAKTLVHYKNKNTEIVAVRNGNTTVRIPVKIDENGKIGFATATPYKFLKTEKKEYGFWESWPAGIKYGTQQLVNYVEGIKLLFTSKEHDVNDNLGSLITIGKTFGGVWDWQRFWMMTGLFSIILAFMNVLPIPALDGGHALFTLIEMVTGRKPSDKFMEYAQMFGMILLLGLMAYALGLDIFRLFK